MNPNRVGLFVSPPSCKQDNGTDLAPQQYFATQAGVWTVHVPHLISLDVYLFPLFAIGLISLLGTAIAVTQRSPQLDIYFCFFVVSRYLVRQLSSSLKCALNSGLFLEWSSVGVSCNHYTTRHVKAPFGFSNFNFLLPCLKSQLFSSSGRCHFGHQSLFRFFFVVESCPLTSDSVDQQDVMSVVKELLWKLKWKQTGHSSVYTICFLVQLACLSKSKPKFSLW